MVAIDPCMHMHIYIYRWHIDDCTHLRVMLHTVTVHVVSFKMS